MRGETLTGALNSLGMMIVQERYQMISKVSDLFSPFEYYYVSTSLKTGIKLMSEEKKTWPVF